MTRLGVYSDTVYRRDRDGLSNHQAFVRFLTSLPPRFDEVVIFGRLDPVGGRSAYALPTRGVRFVPLPHYPRVSSVTAMLRAVRGTCAVFVAELPHLDAVLVFGPHPLALVLAAITRRRRLPLVLGVRQDYPEYIRRRLPNRRWAWARAAAWLLDLAFRGLARSTPTIAVGAALAERYRSGPPVLDTGFSLVRDCDVDPPARALARDHRGELRALSVGRLDPEKNPLLLLHVLAILRAHEPRWRLVVAGAGPLRPALEREAARLGLAASLDLLGEVPHGEALFELYRNSHAFLHVSLTEGVPQVLFEAFAAGVPVVATSVGGVPALLGGTCGLLVPPGDAPAAAAALRRLAEEPRLRAQLVHAGHDLIRGETLERQLDRVAAFVRASAGARSASPPAAPAIAISSQK